MGYTDLFPPNQSCRIGASTSHENILLSISKRDQESCIYLPQQPQAITSTNTPHTLHCNEVCRMLPFPHFDNSTPLWTQEK